jgi:hypothetical protein
VSRPLMVLKDPRGLGQQAPPTLCASDHTRCFLSALNRFDHGSALPTPRWMSENEKGAPLRVPLKRLRE